MGIKMDLKKKLTFQFLLIGMLPIMVLGFVADRIAVKAIERDVTSSMSAIRDNGKNAVANHFKNIENQMALLAADPDTADMAWQLFGAYKSARSDTRTSASELDAMRRDLVNYYNNAFGNEYKAKSGSPAKDVAQYVASLSDDGVWLQHHYIVRNTNPIGSKNALDQSPDRSTYSRIHATRHPYFRDFATKFDLYDIFLVDLASGEIYYTDFKEVDLGSNLVSSPNAKSSIGSLFSNLQRADKPGNLMMSDFANYFPSYEAPAAFVGTTIAHKGRPFAALIFQVSIDKINAMLANRSGLGKTGEVYLVGPDFLMRSDSHLDTKNRSVVNSFLRPETGKIESDAVKQALAGTIGDGFVTNYNNESVLASWTPVQVFGLKWALVAEMTEKEALAPATMLSMWIFSLLALTAVLVSVVGTLIGRSIASPILKIADDLGNNSTQVGEAATGLLKASEQLSEMSQEQAESINETASSMDEISAMVANNVAQAAQSAELSTTVKMTADKGNSSMEKLKAATDEIRESNRQIQDLVRVIGEIADKTAVIDEIVFQTKLLSFNASVEAERAGEHGRGFAVVAQEVGNLAKMSGKASVEIASMVKESVKTAEEITAQNSEKVGMVAQLVTETGSLLSRIGGDAEKLLEQAQQILTASKEQSEGIKQINEAMNQLEQATKQNASAADQTASASDQLKAQADQLGSNVSALLTVIGHSGGAPAHADTRPKAGSSSHGTATHAHEHHTRGSAANVRALRAPTRQTPATRTPPTPRGEAKWDKDLKLVVGGNTNGPGTGPAINDQNDNDEWEKL